MRSVTTSGFRRHGYSPFFPVCWVLVKSRSLPLTGVDRYPDLENNVKKLAAFSTHRKFVDFAGFIGFDKEGNEVFTFGKHRGKKVEDVMDQEPGYFGWLINADFPLYTKKVLTRIKLRKLNGKL